MAQLELPSYEVKPSEDYPDWLLVTCPREDCGETFLVNAKPWRKPRAYTAHNGKKYTVRGRSCPYCFRASRIPARRGSRYT